MNLFSGMFGSPTAQPGYAGGMIEPDALGQASMGAPTAMGSGMGSGGFLSGLLQKWNDMDPMQRQMMMGRIGQGFNAGSSPFNQPMPQMRNVYQNMTPPQGPGQPSLFDHSGMTPPEERERFMRAMQGYGRF